MANSKIVLSAAAMIAIAAAWSGPSSAMNPSSDVVAEVAVETSATDFIQSMADTAMNQLTDHNLDDEVRRKKFVSLMDQYFAMDVVSRFVLGRYWRSISKQEIQEFSVLLQNYLALNYANQFKEFNDEQFVVGDETLKNKDTFVNSQFVRPDGPPINIVWRMRKFDGHYRIIDVSIEGLSMGITQRDEFASVIQKNGGNVSALTDLLEQKTGMK